MTGREFSEVDIDLLADYVGGALDGTPEETVVAQRVADDPAWAEAYADLSAATSTVQADLSAWGAIPEPMPADVADRIATALEQEPSRPALSVVQDADGPRRTVSRPRRRWPAWATPAAIAAGVAVFAGFGISQISSTDSQDAGSNTADQPAIARDNAAGAGEAAPEQPLTVATGQNYTAATLVNAQPPAAARTSGDLQSSSPSTAYSGSVKALGAFADTMVLSECLNAIAREHNRGATTVEVVDFASFDGSPAVIVFFGDTSGARWVWASGPNCGQVAWGADTRGKAQIG